MVSPFEGNLVEKWRFIREEKWREIGFKRERTTARENRTKDRERGKGNEARERERQEKVRRNERDLGI